MCARVWGCTPLLCALLCVLPCVLPCVPRQWQGGMWWKGQRSVIPWRMDRAKAAFPSLPPVPPFSPCAVIRCLQRVTVSLATGCFSALWGWRGVARWRRGSGGGWHKSDTGWNSQMSPTNKVNNFMPLLTTRLGLLSTPPSPTHPTR